MVPAPPTTIPYGVAIAARRPILNLLAGAILLSIPMAPAPARASGSLLEMGRIETVDAAKATPGDAVALFRGYFSLGLYREAASVLERRIRMMTLPIPTAVPLFDELVDAQRRFDSPEHVAAVCETALLNGMRTPKVLFFYGTGLRSVRGRLGDASKALAQVGPGNPYHLPALYALGQIAAERRDVPAAEAIFRRVEQGAGTPGGDRDLARRAARSRAQVLLASGRGEEAAPLFTALLRAEDNPLDRIGLASAAADPVHALEQLPAEVTGNLPLKERIRFLVLFGGLARENGRYGLSVDRLTQAGKELQVARSPGGGPSTETGERSVVAESLRLQAERLRSLRTRLVSTEPRPEEAVRADALELLAGLLLADWTVSRAAAEEPYAGVRFLTPAGTMEVIRRIEAVALDGIDFDRVAEQIPVSLGTLQQINRPSMLSRYPDPRDWSRIEGGDEILVLWDGFRQRRSAAVDGFVSARDRDASRLLRDLWVYTRDIGTLRSASPEAWKITLYHFRMAGRGAGRAGEEVDPFGRAIRETAAFADRQSVVLLAALDALEEKERTAAQARRKQEMVALRAVVNRQLADSYLAQARALQRDPREEARKESFAALDRAVSFLDGDRLTPADAAEVALQAGSLLTEGRGRWEPFPGRIAGERDMAARILPKLPADPPTRPRREASLYLRAALQQAVKDPGVDSATREFLQKYPASPLSAGIGVRLGHEALLAGDREAAVSRYTAAAESGNPETSAVARYMLAWIRLQSADFDGAVRELSRPLSSPSFPCGEPSPFEQAVLSLSVRAWREIPQEKLDPYPPVKGGMCGGKALLDALWEAEEIRGEALRAAKVRDIASRHFLGDEGAAALETRMIGALSRAGQDREAVARALSLREKYGPGSAWALRQKPPVRDKTAVELAGMLKQLSERKFDEGLREGDRSTLSAAAALMGEYFDITGGEAAGEDGELRLKWAIALLGAGDRQGGVSLLEELVGEQREDAVGQRAAVVYAETMIAGYEKMESTADDAEHAALLLMGDHPSAKAASLALRASAAFLEARDYARSRRLAEEVEESRFATPAMVVQARLVQAEAALLEGDIAAARGKAALASGDPAAGADKVSAGRARDLYLLSSLKEVDGRISSGDPVGAAAILEELSARYPDMQEIPLYLLRSTKLYAQGGDGEGAVRSGLRFLREFPRREEGMEVASVIGPILEERKEFTRAGGLYEDVASRFPANEVSPRFLFHSARLAEAHGPPEAAERRFSAFRSRYAAPRWMLAYATLSVGLSAWQRGDTKTSIGLMEDGLGKVDSGMEGGIPEEMAALTAKARIAMGENRARQFRETRLVLPLERSLATKDRLFRLALGDFSRAEREAPLEISLKASQLSGDLFLDYGKAVLESQRPKGLTGSERDAYEEELKTRARALFERSVDRYAGALERLGKEGGASYLAVPIRERLAAAQALLEGAAAGKGGGPE